jgi:L-asparaginase II
MNDELSVSAATLAAAVKTHPPHVPLAAATRGAMIDAVHHGSVAVCDRDGRILHSAGNPRFLAPTRSALKPFQAIPLVAAGGVERFGFTRPEVALMCASHSGETRHVDAAGSVLAKTGHTMSDLQCGTHVPGHYEISGTCPPPPPYSPLAHNCSGKHSGMLAWCALCGAPKETYLAFEHPLQVEIRRCVAHFTGIDAADLVRGIDGCSAPNYAVPLSALATAFARLAAGDDDAQYGPAARVLADAMTGYPEMVSGSGRNDLAYMQAGRGDWVTKIGAEGIQAIGVRSRGIGIVVKVADGNKRGLHPATVAVLDQLGLLDDAQREALVPWSEPPVRNCRGIVTGRIKPLVVLDKGAPASVSKPCGEAAVGRKA